MRQHGTFLKEFAVGGEQTDDVISWMRTLPLFLEYPGFRVVHACWNEDIIDMLRMEAPAGILYEEQFIRAAKKQEKLYNLVEVTTKGPEIALPNGFSFKDKDGTVRSEVRLQWWNGAANTWPELAISVPDEEELPKTEVPPDVLSEVYSISAKPVFFGHYWLSGVPVLQAHNALCLDYSAGKDGPLVSYQMDGKPTGLTLNKLSVHA